MSHIYKTTVEIYTDYNPEEEPLVDTLFHVDLEEAIIGNQQCEVVEDDNLPENVKTFYRV